uniref:Riboflavin synthase n=1 Tax=Schlesneria paludicola TaxID=360056 RepID=A0A7C4QQ75_9PLAN
MFTGLVEGLGTVAAMRREVAGLRLEIAPPEPLRSEGSPLGSSVALNGCCLTVVAADTDGWAFQAGEETLSKTNLGLLRVGDPVNLERSLPVTGRLGGHFVQGHVDGVGTVQAVERTGDWVRMAFAVPEALAELMVPKGSVAVDGVSLTLVTVGRNQFDVALIPHTLAVTTLGCRQVGDTVNIETDILGKYVRKFLLLDGHPARQAVAAS